MSASRDEEKEVYKATFQDYWVDLLGGLLPGALVVVVLIGMFFPALLILTYSVSGKGSLLIGASIINIIKATKGTPSALWFGLAAMMLSIIYIIGHVFYRKDPKWPDKNSFKKLMRDEAKRQNIDIKNYMQEMKVARNAFKEYLVGADGADKNVVSYDEFIKDRVNEETISNESYRFRNSLKKEYGCTITDDCEFPYPYFGEYLENRGLDYLKRFVLWEKNIDYRTKNVINILKIRIRFDYPDKCATIIRNEAHVRLASSTWYVGRVLMLGAVSALLVIITAVSIYAWRTEYLWEAWSRNPDYFAQVGVVTIFILLLGVGGLLARKHIESFMHYQRQREVVHVLETAWTAFSSEDERFIPFCK